MANTEYLPPIAELLVGRPFGDVYPPGQPLAVETKDGRTACLEVLAHFLAAIPMAYPPGCDRNPGLKAPPLPFSIPASRIEIEEPPPNPAEHVTKYPSIGIVALGEAENASLGLGTYLDESTIDKFGKGTALQRQAEHVETLGLEVWAESRPERRAVIAALENALSPTEQMAGLYLRIPAYYLQVARFTLKSTSLDDSLAGEMRWRATIKVELNFTVVALVRWASFAPSASVQTLEAGEECSVLSTE